MYCELRSGDKVRREIAAIWYLASEDTYLAMAVLRFKSPTVWDSNLPFLLHAPKSVWLRNFLAICGLFNGTSRVIGDCDLWCAKQLRSLEQTKTGPKPEHAAFSHILPTPHEEISRPEVATLLQNPCWTAAR